jgi:hypothetical protein
LAIVKQENQRKTLDHPSVTDSWFKHPSTRSKIVNDWFKKGELRDFVWSWTICPYMQQVFNQGDLWLWLSLGPGPLLPDMHNGCSHQVMFFQDKPIQWSSFSKIQNGQAFKGTQTWAFETWKFCQVGPDMDRTVTWGLLSGRSGPHQGRNNHPEPRFNPTAVFNFTQVPGLWHGSSMSIQTWSHSVPGRNFSRLKMSLRQDARPENIRVSRSLLHRMFAVLSPLSQTLLDPDLRTDSDTTIIFQVPDRAWWFNDLTCDHWAIVEWLESFFATKVQVVQTSHRLFLFFSESTFGNINFLNNFLPI